VKSAAKVEGIRGGSAEYAVIESGGMPILAQFSGAAQEALERQQRWTATDFAEIIVWSIVCFAGGMIVDSVLRQIIAKKSA
jgi:hypothetical protein